ncbi:MAG TPA: cytochrome ubiquinol oxidase subunit I, partial [Vicinamibacterales bacterium]|nr:cytochrome ubiquinol oxidase subunit I [Vicinamibacterales bacterium]
MNYPIWSLPAPGLLIAAVAILHVFISHFAVGGGLFLVLAERKARRERDEGFLGYVKRHSRFFVLLTLVLGAITGVGIWFTIGLVHPQATSSLINTFVWAWAIEWTFFVTEIAAALVYYYGWERLSPRTHMAVGWIYFGAAWLSLVAINGILSFMLTPGGWIQTGSFWAGLLNPTYWSSMFARTFVAIGLAGLYALLTAARLEDRALKARVVRFAGRWIVAMTIALPVSIAWFLASAQGAGIPVLEILGAPSGRF